MDRCCVPFRLPVGPISPSSEVASKNMKRTLVAAASPLLLLMASALAQTDSARELKRLQDERDKAMAAAAEPINRRHAAALEQLLRRSVQSNDTETANKIRADLQKLGITASSTGAGASNTLGQ